MLDGEVPTLGSLGGVFGGLVGHEPGDRLGDQPLERGQTDAVRERRHLGVHEPRRLGASPRVASAIRRARHGLEVPGLHPGPGPAQPVLQLHRRRDQRTTGVGGATDREGELRDAELRDQRRTLTSEREAGVAGGGDPGRLCADRLRWVLLGPGHRRDQQHRVRADGSDPGLACHRSTSRGVELSEVIAAVDVMGQFKQRPLTHSGEFPLLWKGILDRSSRARAWSRLASGVRPLVSSVARFARCSTTCRCCRLRYTAVRGQQPQRSSEAIGAPQQA